MSLVVTLNGSAVGTNRLRLSGQGRVQATAAADGTGSAGAVVFDDPNGDLTVTGWMPVTVEETACTAPRLFTGYCAERTYRRGEYFVGAGREIDTTLVDQNALLSLRLIVNSDGKRPAETDTARIAWLLASPYLSGLVYDVGWITTPGRAFDEADYRGQYPADVLNDLCGPRGQIFFAAWYHATSRVGLFFDSPTSVTNTSTLTISNVASDVNDTTCFAPNTDGELVADPSEVYSRLRYTYKRASLVTNNTTTSSTFFPSPLVTRGLQVTNERVGRLSTATTFSERILAQRSVEAKTVTFTVRLPASKVGLIDAGQRIGLRFTHLPGFETLAYSRVERKSIVQTEGTNDYYDVTLTCSTYGLTTAIGGGSPGDFPHEPNPPSIVQQISGTSTLVMPLPITAGNTLVVSITNLGPGAGRFDYTTHGYTLGPLAGAGGAMGTLYKTAGASESQTLGMGANVRGTWYELPGTWTPGTSDMNSAATATGNGIVMTGGPITVGTGSIVFAIGTIGTGGACNSVQDTLSFTPGAGMIEDLDARLTPNLWTGHAFPSAGSFTAQTTNSANVPVPNTPGFLYDADVPWEMHAVEFVGDATDSPPEPGQPVLNELASMAGAVGTLDYPYSEGSLVIRVDGVLISSASITETNPGAGTFTLSWAPDADESVRVDYLGR